MIRKTVALLVFDDVNVIDFAGPLEIFAAANTDSNNLELHTDLVGATAGTIRTRHKLKLVPAWTLEGCPPSDGLVLPGGPGIARLLLKPALVEWVAIRAHRARAVLAIGEGKRLLVKGGVIDDQPDEASLPVSLYNRKIGSNSRNPLPQPPIGVVGRSPDSIFAGALHLVAELLGPAASKSARHRLLSEELNHGLHG